MQERRKQAPARALLGAAPLLVLATLAWTVPISGCDSPTAGEQEGTEENAAGEDEGAALAKSFDAARTWALLEKIVAIGPRPSGSSKSDEQRDLIESELKALGLDVTREPFTDRTPIGNVSFENLYVDIGATAPDAPMVVVGSHFDTKRMHFDFVGANDGGSSTAVLIELARVLKDRPSQVTWRLLFLDGEEAIRPNWADPDNRYGSRFHVKQLEETGALSRVKAMVLLDLVGDKDLRFMTDTNSTPELLRMFFDTARANGLGDHVYGKQQQVLDDHLSFLAKGIPSVDLIDLEFGPYNSYWHSENDTLENCSQESLGATGRIVLHTLPKLEAWVLARR